MRSLVQGSGNSDVLRDQFGVKAVEMEGSGIANATWLQGVEYTQRLVGLPGPGRPFDFGANVPSYEGEKIDPTSTSSSSAILSCISRRGLVENRSHLLTVLCETPSSSANCP